MKTRKGTAAAAADDGQGQEDERTVATQEMEKIPYGKECMQAQETLLLFCFISLLLPQFFSY